jgi:PAS fold
VLAPRRSQRYLLWTMLLPSCHTNSFDPNFTGTKEEAGHSMVETIEHSLRSGDPIDVECRVRTSSGDWRWIHSRGTPRRDETGKIIRWYGSADDIDSRKRLEEELRRRVGSGNFRSSDVP